MQGAGHIHLVIVKNIRNKARYNYDERQELDASKSIPYINPGIGFLDFLPCGSISA
jgi:hypothetical protein